MDQHRRIIRKPTDQEKASLTQAIDEESSEQSMKLNRAVGMTPAECIKFLREEVEMALSDGCPIAAANLRRCANCLESLWNAPQQRGNQ